MQIIGHRGARGEAPENTLGGFRYLKDLGIRAVEFDVRQLTDQCLVVMHDDDFLRTAGCAHPLQQCTQAELAQFNQAQHWQNWPHLECTPRLYEVLQLLHDFEHIEVEVKSVQDMAAAENLVCHLVDMLGDVHDHVTITSFDAKIHQALKQIPRYFKQGFLIEEDLGQAAIDLAVELGCGRIGWKDSLLTEDLCQASFNANLLVSVWTVNDIQRAHQLNDWGITGLITDIPKQMQHVFCPCPA